MRRLPFAHWLRGRPVEAGEPVPDAELLARFAGAGDEAAFELLVWRHAALVLGVCRRVVRDDHLAEDAFQAAFLVLARKAGSVRGANLAGWLFRVARRVSARARRQAEARAKRETPLSADVADAPLPCPAEDRESLAVLDEEVARLPERFRRPVLLCYLGGRTTEDAARVLGCPRGTVLSRLATARQRLAVRLTRRGVTLPAGVLGTVAVPSVSGVVPPTVRASLAFLAAGSRLTTSNPILLANGALTAMKLGNTLTAGAVLVLAASLFGGYALVAGPGEGVTTVRAAADPPKAEAPAKKVEPTPPGQKEDAETLERRKQDVQQLQQVQQAVMRIEEDVLQLRRRLRAFHEAVKANDPETARRRAELASRTHELDRELLVDEVRELAKQERAARGTLAELERQDPALQPVSESLKRQINVAQNRAKRASDELNAAKAEVRKLDQRLLAAAERDALDQLAVHEEVPQLTQILEVKQKLLTELIDRRERLELQVRGVQLAERGGIPPDVLVELMKEVRELRREVRELKRK